MTEQQACTLCGAGGHLAAQCNWNKAEGAQGERERFEAAYERGDFPSLEGPYDNPRKNQAFNVWMARAALAQPSPAPDIDFELLRQTADLVRGRFSAALDVAYAASEHSSKVRQRAEDAHQALIAMIDAAAVAPVAQAGQVPEALREGFMTSCSGNGKYEVKIQFSNLPAAQESHNFLVKLIASSVQGGA